MLKKNRKGKEATWQKYEFLQGQLFLKSKYVFKVALQVQNCTLRINCTA